MEKCYVVTDYMYFKKLDGSDDHQISTILAIFKSLNVAKEFAQRQIPIGEDKTIYEDCEGSWTSYMWHSLVKAFKISHIIGISEHALID